MTTERDGMRMATGPGVWGHRRSNCTGRPPQGNARGRGASPPDFHDQAGGEPAGGRGRDPVRQGAIS